MIVVEGGSEKRYSFWADDPGQERVIFEQFLDVVAGVRGRCHLRLRRYERAFLKRMRKVVREKGNVTRR